MVFDYIERQQLDPALQGTDSHCTHSILKSTFYFLRSDTTFNFTTLQSTVRAILAEIFSYHMCLYILQHMTIWYTSHELMN